MFKFFEQVVLTQSSWVLRWRYDVAERKFSWWSQEHPEREYSHYMLWSQFQDFQRSVANNKSVGHAINKKVKILPEYTPEVNLTSLESQLNALNQGDRRDALNELERVAKLYGLRI